MRGIGERRAADAGQIDVHHAVLARAERAADRGARPQARPRGAGRRRPTARSTRGPARARSRARWPNRVRRRAAPRRASSCSSSRAHCPTGTCGAGSGSAPAAGPRGSSRRARAPAIARALGENSTVQRCGSCSSASCVAAPLVVGAIADHELDLVVGVAAARAPRSGCAAPRRSPASSRRRPDHARIHLRQRHGAAGLERHRKPAIAEAREQRQAVLLRQRLAAGDAHVARRESRTRARIASMLHPLAAVERIGGIAVLAAQRTAGEAHEHRGQAHRVRLALQRMEDLRDLEAASSSSLPADSVASRSFGIAGRRFRRSARAARPRCRDSVCTTLSASTRASPLLTHAPTA